jgi:hypothetical protein
MSKEPPITKTTLVEALKEIGVVTKAETPERGR